MARPLRMERAGAWYHVTARGTERRVIFADDRDRRRWMELVAEAVAVFNLVVHGYVLMDNHYHLMVETREANLSRAMQWLQTSYSMGFNRRHRRVGPLFQGRFKAIVVDRAGWGLELSRYVHLNPVRTARMGLDKRARQADRLGAGGRPDRRQVQERVERLRNYRWSSYRAYAGWDKAPEWMNCTAVLELGGGGGTVRERQRRYQQYVEGAIREGMQTSPWEHVQAQLVLGGCEFLEKIRRKVGGLASGTTATPGTEAAAELERGADGSRRVVRREMGSAPGSARPLGAGVGIVFGPPDLRAASGRVGIRSGRNGLRGSECGDQAL